MARSSTMYKPGETAPASGTYYCYICSLRGERSNCEISEGEMFVACPRCLEAKVAEWDMTWKSEGERPGKGRARATSPWPGSLTRPS